MPPFNRITSRMTTGTYQETYHPNAIKCCFSELLSTFIFIFAGEGSLMAYNNISSDGSTTAASLVMAAIAYGFGLFCGVSVGYNVSGGHCNPAVTFGAFMGGNISFFSMLLYWFGQLLGSSLACFLLRFCTNWASAPVFTISSSISWVDALCFEAIMTFTLVAVVYATAVDPAKGRPLAALAPLTIGGVVLANILAGGPFSGAAMNPAVAFGPALVSWSWSYQWIYWVGPLAGAGFAGLIFEHIMIVRDGPQPIPTIV